MLRRAECPILPARNVALMLAMALAMWALIGATVLTVWPRQISVSEVALRADAGGSRAAPAPDLTFPALAPRRSAGVSDRPQLKRPRAGRSRAQAGRRPGRSFASRVFAPSTSLN